MWGWGRNLDNELGIPIPPDISLLPMQLGKETNWQMVSAGFNYTVAEKKDSTLWAWGVNSWGMLGTGDNLAQNAPKQIGSDNNWEVVAAGQAHSFGIKQDGTIWGWGANQNGQLGIGSVVKQLNPVQVGKDK